MIGISDYGRCWTRTGKSCFHLLGIFKSIISLREALIRVHREGSIDLAILFLAARHLLPAPTDWFCSSLSLKIVEAGKLNRRHTTGDCDDIVVWSLLSDIRIFDAAKMM